MAPSLTKNLYESFRKVGARFNIAGVLESRNFSNHYPQIISSLRSVWDYQSNYMPYSGNTKLVVIKNAHKKKTA